MNEGENRSFTHIQVFVGIITVVFFLLAGKLWFLQVVGGTELRKLAEGNRIRAVPLEAPRGSIYDRNSKLLAGNKQSIVVTISKEQSDNKDVLNKLSGFLNLTAEEIQKNIESQGKKLGPYLPRIISSDIDIKTASAIAERKSDLPGVEVQSRPVRLYPNDSGLAHVLGYIGEVSEKELASSKTPDYSQGDIIGKMGVERSYENVLRGQKGGRQIEVDASGRLKRVLSSREAIPGHSLGLTVDMRIQEITENVLAKAIRTARKKGAGRAAAGAAVVLDPNNGEIIAMASMPSFDLNDFIGGIKPSLWTKLNDKKNHYPLNNRAIMAMYPPGSTFKPVTAIAGYDSKLIGGTTTVNCTGKWYGQGKKWPKLCWKRSGHGRVSIVSAIAQSCDVYFYEIGFKLWKKQSEKLQDVARSFGFGKLTGVDLPWEKKGRIPDKEWKRQWNKNNPSNQTWLPGDNVNMSIGQGDMLATPLQVANMYAALANGGKLYQPHVLKNIISSDGSVVRKIDPVILQDNLASPLLKYINGGLRGVIVRGTGKMAFAGFPVNVAGKTGTSQVWGKDDFAWFVAYGPVPNLKYVVAMVIEEGGSGGSVAAPAVREIFGKIYDLPDSVSQIEGVVDHSR